METAADGIDLRRDELDLPQRSGIQRGHPGYLAAVHFAGMGVPVRTVRPRRKAIRQRLPNDPTLKSFMQEMDFRLPHAGLINSSTFDGAGLTLSSEREEHIYDVLTMDNGR